MNYDSQVVETVAYTVWKDVASQAQSFETGDDDDGLSGDDESVIVEHNPDVAERQES